ETGPWRNRLQDLVLRNFDQFLPAVVRARRVVVNGLGLLLVPRQKPLGAPASVAVIARRGRFEQVRNRVEPLGDQTDETDAVFSPPDRFGLMALVPTCRTQR